MKKTFLKGVCFVFVTLTFILSSYWIYKNIDINGLFGQVEKVREEEITKDNPDISSNLSEINNSKRVFKIVDKDIVEVISPNSLNLLVDGDNIEGALSLFDLSVSPDGEKMCFLVQTMVPVWLYLYDIKEKELSKIDVAKNCFWSPNGNYIAYNNHTTDVGPVDVYIYSIDNGKIKNLTEDIFTDRYLGQFCKIKWENEKEISTTGEKISWSDIDSKEGNGYVFDVETGEVKYITKGSLNCN